MLHRLAEHERAVVYTLGRISAVKGPGLVALVPLLQTMKRVDLRPVVAQVRHAAVTYRVADPAKALEQVVDYARAMETLVETTVAKVLEGRPADALVFERQGIEAAIRQAVGPACASWGLAIDKVVVNR